MRAPLSAAFGALALVPVLARTACAQATGPRAPKPMQAELPDPTRPQALGHFDDWVAATHYENGQRVCYAFTRATASSPPIAGRPPVVLTVAERPSGRDSVAIASGLPFAAGAEVTVQVGQTGSLSFYTTKSDAFARDGAAAVLAFRAAEDAVARSPGPKGVTVVDGFSLHGFVEAYRAAVKACPR